MAWYDGPNGAGKAAEMQLKKLSGLFGPVYIFSYKIHIN